MVEHCDMHAQNTQTLNQCATDISGIKGSLTTGRWILGIIISVAILIIASTVGEIKDGIKEIKSDVKQVATLQYRVERLEQDFTKAHR